MISEKRPEATYVYSRAMVLRYFIGTTLVSCAFVGFIAFAQWKISEPGPWPELYLCGFGLWLIMALAGLLGFALTSVQVFHDGITWKSGFGGTVTCRSLQIAA